MNILAKARKALHVAQFWPQLAKLRREPKTFLGVLSRCKDEWFLAEFCEHYLNEGVDSIIIIDDNSGDKSIYDGLGDKVTVIYANKVLEYGFERVIYRACRHLFDWLIVVDIDEFLTTKCEPDRTVKDELEQRFADADCVMVPWVMMAANGRKASPSSIVDENTFRWDHDKKHPHDNPKFRCRYDEIEVKCIFRPRAFEDVTFHYPTEATSNELNIVESVDNTPYELGPMYYGLREAAIERAILLCYHYRIISVEDCERKIATSKIYQDRKIVLDEMMQSDHSDIEDTYMRDKTRQRRNIA